MHHAGAKKKQSYQNTNVLFIIKDGLNSCAATKWGRRTCCSYCVMAAGYMALVLIMNPAQSNRPLTPSIKQEIYLCVLPIHVRRFDDSLKEPLLVISALCELCSFSQNKVRQLIIFHLLSETLCCIYNVLYLGPSPLYMSINISYQPLSLFIALNHGL